MEASTLALNALSSISKLVVLARFVSVCNPLHSFRAIIFSWNLPFNCGVDMDACAGEGDNYALLTIIPWLSLLQTSLGIDGEKENTGSMTVENVANALKEHSFFVVRVESEEDVGTVCALFRLVFAILFIS